MVFPPISSDRNYSTVCLQTVNGAQLVGLLDWLLPIRDVTGGSNHRILNGKSMTQGPGHRKHSVNGEEASQSVATVKLKGAPSGFVITTPLSIGSVC